MAYTGGGGGSATDWEAREELWHLKRTVADLQRQVAELTARLNAVAPQPAEGDSDE